MTRKNWGIPWMGSKSRFVGFVVDALPAAGTLVDLFARGCSVTHAAMESGKFGRVIANDLGPGPSRSRRQPSRRRGCRASRASLDADASSR